MGMIFYDYEFKSEEFQNAWRCITSNTFKNMELHYRKQFSMSRLLSYFRKAFKVAPITLKNSIDNKHYTKKLLAIYLLIKYSNEKYEVIAEEFHISLDTVILISSNTLYKTTFQDEIKLFFKQFEDTYFENQKTLLALRETIKLDV